MCASLRAFPLSRSRHVPTSGLEAAAGSVDVGRASCSNMPMLSFLAAHISLRAAPPRAAWLLGVIGTVAFPGAAASGARLWTLIGQQAKPDELAAR